MDTFPTCITCKRPGAYFYGHYTCHSCSPKILAHRIEIEARQAAEAEAAFDALRERLTAERIAANDHEPCDHVNELHERHSFVVLVGGQ